MKKKILRGVSSLVLFIILNLIDNIIAMPYDSLPILPNLLKDSSSDPLTNTCFCDKTTNACDPYCCCDSACAVVNQSILLRIYI